MWLIRHFLYFLCLVIVFVNANENELVNARKHGRNSSQLNMTIFYESLCPDSIDFFKKQFAPNWLPFYSYLNVTLVPYGNANTTRNKKMKYSFECQHGPDECKNNRIQACAISKLDGFRRKKLFSFVSCYMSSKKQKQNGPKCASKNNIKYRMLKSCSARKEGNELLAYYGNVTHNFKPKITWIPTIVFNNKFNKTENTRAASDLKSLLCAKLKNKPKVCHNKKYDDFR